MTFKDIFKKSFIQGYSRFDLSPSNMLIVFAISLGFAVYIFLVYRLLTRKTFYSKTFNIALAALVLITTAVIMTIQSSVVISLGMVGALSIVRFRTAIKEPMDLVFLFWAISTGIICGAGLSMIACVLALSLTVILVVLDRIPIGRAPKILMITAQGYEAESTLVEIVKTYCRFYTVKSRSLANNQTNLVIEVHTAHEADLVRAISAHEAVVSSSLLAHDGEVTF